jgi:hypothetical protein
MRAIFKSKESKEILRLVKSTDMALFIWELVHNGWREFKHTDYDYQPAWDKIHQLLEEHNINPDDLLD